MGLPKCRNGIPLCKNGVPSCCCCDCPACCDINSVTVTDPLGNPYTLTFVDTIDLSDFVCLSNLIGECAWQLTEVAAHGCIIGGCEGDCLADGYYNLIFWCQELGGEDGLEYRFAWERYILDPGDGVTKVCCESNSCTPTCVDGVFSSNCDQAWTMTIT
jgi:hypothetical protein